MSNLLIETLEILRTAGKSSTDVEWVGNSKVWFTWQEFEELADTEYDKGFGAQEVAQDVLVVGKDWWLERGEYDGAEWWEYKTLPLKPSKQITLRALTVAQRDGSRIGWESLAELNNLEETND